MMPNNMEIYSHSYLVLEVITGYLDDKKQYILSPRLGSKENWKEMANPEKNPNKPKIPTWSHVRKALPYIETIKKNFF